MKKNLKKMRSYYRPYMGIFIADMIFAILAAVVSLVIPLVVRYITSDVVFRDSSVALAQITRLGIFMLLLIAGQCFCNFFISFYKRICYYIIKEKDKHYEKRIFNCNRFRWNAHSRI